MNIEKQVATLEQSKRLKELGVKIKTYFCWADIGKLGILLERTAIYKNQLPAHTAEEIAELLPANFCIGPREYNLDMYKDGEDFLVRYEQHFTRDPPCSLIEFSEKSLTQALTSMLIWLIENKHINPKELR